MSVTEATFRGFEQREVHLSPRIRSIARVALIFLLGISSRALWLLFCLQRDPTTLLKCLSFD